MVSQLSSHLFYCAFLTLSPPPAAQMCLPKDRPQPLAFPLCPAPGKLIYFCRKTQFPSICYRLQNSSPIPNSTQRFKGISACRLDVTSSMWARMVDMPAEETVSEAPLSTEWWGIGIECESGCPRGWWWDHLCIHRCRSFPWKNQNKSLPWAWLCLWKQNLWLWLTELWITVVVVIKKNNKVNFKI